MARRWRRQCLAGHTLADLKSALEIARRERAETEALARDEREPPAHRILRLTTVASATWLAVTIGLLLQGVIDENVTSIWWFLVPVASTMLLGAVSNALDVQFIPSGIRKWWQTGIRERLWSSRVGEWLARRLGAPERPQLAGASAFRATEAALGVAASELFAALPQEYREQLAVWAAGAFPELVDRTGPRWRLPTVSRSLGRRSPRSPVDSSRVLPCSAAGVSRSKLYHPSMDSARATRPVPGPGGSRGFAATVTAP
jgi:hypothetical protein